MMKLTTLPLGAAAPKEINAVVEIPKGSKNQYEYQPEWHAFFLDRVLPGPLRFPTAYGFIPQTVGPDGDEVDVLIIQDEPVTVGIVLRVRPIGMFTMRWQNSAKQDDKIVSVSVNDPMYADCHSMDVLAKHYFAEIDYFFRSYLDLGDPGISTDWGDAETARRAGGSRAVSRWRVRSVTRSGVAKSARRGSSSRQTKTLRPLALLTERRAVQA